MTYTGEQIKAAIDEWAASEVDAEIARESKVNADYNEKYGGRTNYLTGGKTPWPTSPEEFSRDEVQSRLAEEFYDLDGDKTIDLPGIGTAKLVDSYGGEGQGDEYWRVFEIDGEFYKADHYYNSYDVEPWHYECTIFPVVGREKTITEWVAQ